MLRCLEVRALIVHSLPVAFEASVRMQMGLVVWVYRLYSPTTCTMKEIHHQERMIT